MLFRRISHRIALQFTGFVFLLFLINGLFFFTADISNTQRQMRFRLERMAEMIAERYEPDMMHMPHMPRGGVPLHLLEQVRVLDTEGNTLLAGSFFEGVPIPQKMRALARMTIEGEEFIVLTDPFQRNGRLAGYVQIADIARFPYATLPGRITLYLLISIAVSLLTYIVGLFFARRSLQPAEHMMERLEQFTQDASHELKTPLTAVGTSIDLALLDGAHKKHLSTAKRELKEISLLVDRLLELARLDRFALQKEKVSMNDLIIDTVIRHQTLAESAQITIEQTLAPNSIVQGDPALLRQLVSNLLANAIKFSASGSHINITLTQTSMIIQDAGKGIPAAALPHIFDRFYQEDTSRTKANSGIGLGLALVKRITELHGWKISVKSIVGKGTTFTVRFH